MFLVASHRYIVFCAQKHKKKGFSWKGLNQIHEKLITALSPSAKVYTLPEIRGRTKKAIRCEKAILSSRVCGDQ